jgi:hypothetical protein
MDITDLVNNAMNQWAEETDCGETDPAFGGEIGEDIDKLVDGLSVFEVKTLLKTEKPIVFVEGDTDHYEMLSGLTPMTAGKVGNRKFRKRPVIIEAFRMGIDPIPDWFMDKVTTNDIILQRVPFHESRPDNYGQTRCEIKTLEGVMVGNEGDYIIQGVNGEIYPCKPDIFNKTYERVG